jgi:hypothetical protein
MKKSVYIDPFKTEDVTYWTRKWHITPTQLFNAIMDTGSNHISILKNRLTPKKSSLISLGKKIVEPYFRRDLN